jgi:Reverse transcriptase (RNA-dependent DNA polymerase)
MSEGALVNTGAVCWPDSVLASIAVRSMQIKLHRWAGEDPFRRFGDLFNLVYDPAFLVAAWERVSTNRGAKTAGIDKVTAAWVETVIGVGAFLGQIRDSLKSGGFRPVEVRQVMVPKGATGKFRKLGIPTIADRVVQASLKSVLEPIFEADFQPCSYGFRPIRRPHDAIAEIHHLASAPRDYHWALECDIRVCFDEISHTALMDRLRIRIKDKRVCDIQRHRRCRLEPVDNDARIEEPAVRDLGHGHLPRLLAPCEQGEAFGAAEHKSAVPRPVRARARCTAKAIGRLVSDGLGSIPRGLPRDTCPGAPHRASARRPRRALAPGSSGEPRSTG